MPRRIPLTAVGLILLLALPAYADKGSGESMALSYLCDLCTYEYSDHELFFLDSLYQTSRHAFTFDADDHWVDEIHVNVDFDAIWGFWDDTLIIEIDSFFVTYDSVLVDTLDYSNISGQHLHYKLYLADSSQFSADDTVFIVSVRYLECNVFLGTGLDVVHNGSETGYRNGFYDAVDGYFYEIPSGGLTNGHRSYQTPNAKLVLVPDPPPINYWADSSHVGGSVGLAVYANDINFYYSSGYEFTIQHVSGITFDFIDTTAYSSDPTIDTLNDTTLRFSLASYDGPSPVELMLDTFMIVHFDIDTDAEPDTTFKVWIEGDYIFSTGCQAYADTNSNAGNEAYYVKSVREWASLRFDMISVDDHTQDIPYRFYMKNSAPIYTDNNNQDENASFAFDSSLLTYTEYDDLPVDFTYNGSGTIRWTDDVVGTDTLVIKESSMNQSSEIVASPLDYDTIGYMIIDSKNGGVDWYKFVERESGTPLNYVVVKHTLSILTPDSVVNGTGYGDFELLKGKVTVTAPPPPPPCPTLYTWQGTGYVVENPILTHSQGKRDPSAQDDYLPIMLGIAEEDGYYRIQIRETSDQISFIDQIQLIAVDYPLQSKVGISSEGEVFTYQRSIEPIAAVDEWGRDLMPYVGKLDDVWMDVSYPGSMILTYPNPFYGRQSFAFALNDEPDPPPKKKKITPENTDGQGDNIVAEIEDVHGNWYYLGAIPPREYQGENSKWLFNSDQAELGETFRVKVSWKVTYQTDLQALELADNSSFVERRLSPRFAEHSDLGAVTRSLATVDDDVLTIKPGEQVELKFRVPAGTGEKGYARKFFLKSRGFYRTFTPDDALPTDYALDHNYPNPFNPTTTISFALPVGSDVSLVVYNVLGQEVKTLYRGYLEAGNHKLEWGGDNNAEEPVASGVYFYRLKAGSFEQSKKMTLLK